MAAAATGKVAHDRRGARARIANAVERHTRDFYKDLEHSKTLEAGAERDGFLKPKYERFTALTEELVERWNAMSIGRGTNFANDVAADANVWQIAGAVGIATLFAGMAIGAVVVPKVTEWNIKPGKIVTVYKDKPLDKNFHAENGTLYDNATAIADSMVTAKVAKNVLFTDQMIDEAKSLIDKTYKTNTKIKFNKDASMDVHLENADKTIVVNNHIDAKTAHEKVYKNLTGSKDVNYTFLPQVKEGATDVVVEVDGSMLAHVSSKIVGATEFNAMRMVYKDGNLTGQIGNVSKDGKFTSAKNISGKEVKDALNYLGDANDDADQTVTDMVNTLKDNYNTKVLKAYETADLAHKDFLKHYGVFSDTDLGKMISNITKEISNLTNVTNKLIKDHKASNLSDLDQKMKALEALKVERDALLLKYDKDNVSALDQMIEDTNMYVGQLEQGWLDSNNSYKAIIKGWMQNVTDTVNEYTRYLNENKSKYDKQIADLKDVYETEISELNQEITELQSSLNVDVFKNAYDNGTDVFRFIESLAQDPKGANLTGLALNWSDPVVKNKFRSLNISGARDMADIFDEQGVVRVDIQDAFNVGDERSAVLVSYVMSGGKLVVKDYYELDEDEWQSVKDSAK